MRQFLRRRHSGTHHSRVRPSIGHDRFRRQKGGSGAGGEFETAVVNFLGFMQYNGCTGRTYTPRIARSVVVPPRVMNKSAAPRPPGM